MSDTAETPTEKMPVFSPSQTGTFTFCPRKWALDRERWVTRLVEYPELCGVFGTAYAKSMEEYNKAIQRIGAVPPTPYLGSVVEAGVADADAALRKINMDGRHIERMSDREFADAIPTKLKKAVELYHKHNPYKEYKILAVEKTYPDHGNCRPDLLVESPQGDIIVVDYKVKIKLEAA